MRDSWGVALPGLAPPSAQLARLCSAALSCAALRDPSGSVFPGERALATRVMFWSTFSHSAFPMSLCSHLQGAGPGLRRAPSHKCARNLQLFLPSHKRTRLSPVCGLWHQRARLWCVAHARARLRFWRKSCTFPGMLRAGKIPREGQKERGAGREMLPVENGGLAKILVVGIFHLVKRDVSHVYWGNVAVRHSPHHSPLLRIWLIQFWPSYA